MDVIVLAGGYATRLWPITRHRPKILLPIGEGTVVGKTLEQLEQDDRIEDVYISTNERFAPEFENHLRDVPYDKPQVSIEQTASESEKFGVVGALSQIISREQLTDDTLVIAGDNLIGFDLSDFIDTFERHEQPTIAAYDIGSYERASEYGLIELDADDRVTDFQEKPNEPQSTLVSIACYAFPGKILNLFDEYLADDNNPDEPGWFIQWLQNRQSVRAFCFEEAWFDIGTPESYLDAISWKLAGDNVVHPEATVNDTELRGNVQIHRGAEVTASTLKETVVFPDATVSESEIRRTIIDEQTHIDSLNLSGTVIGSHTQINGT